MSDNTLHDPDAERAAKMLPRPTGWRILCTLPEAEQTFEGTSIVKADTFIKKEEHATVVLHVLEVGPQAYKDAERFPEGPWCKEGDFVLVRTYAGTRFKINGKEFRVINDDMVEAVVEDPRGILRAGA